MSELRVGLTIGGAISPTLNRAFRSVQSSSQRLSAQLGRSYQTGQRSATQYATNLDRVVSGHRKVERSANAAGRSIKTLEQRQKALQNKQQELKSELFGVVGAALTLAAPIKAAIEFESVMADVRKVVDFESPAQFKAMNKDILLLSTSMPMAASGIGEIVEQAGQAGIARHELLRFAKDAATMGVAFDMTGKESGAAMTGLRTIFKLNQTEVVSLGDSYNHLSNNMDATASNMLNISNRAGANASLFGINGQQLGALSATFLALKSPPEVAATGINALLLKLATADKQSKKFQQGLADIGLSAEGLKAAIKEDAQGALVSFLETVEKSPDVMGTLSDLFGAEYADDIAKLVGGLDQYKKALGYVSNKTAYAGSMQKEYAERAKTTANNLQLFKNRATRLGVVLGTVLLPTLNKTLGVIGDSVSTVAELSEKYPLATKAIMGTVGALIISRVVFFAARWAWIALARSALGYVSAMKKIKRGIVLLGGAMRAIALTNPIGLVISAVVVLGLVVYRNWEKIKSFVGGVVAGFKEAAGPIVEAFKPVEPIIKAVGETFDYLVTSVGNLFSPIQSSTQELDKAASAGKKFGNWLAEGVKIALFPLSKLIQGISWVFENFHKIGGAVDKVFKGVDHKANPHLKKPSGYVSLKDGGRQSPIAPKVSKAKSLRPRQINQTNTYQITVNQLPGQDGRQLAQELVDITQKKRGALYDSDQ